jgi:cell division protein FtsQ
MKIIRFVVSILIFLGISILMIWAIIKSNDQTCNQLSILIHAAENSKLLTESDVLHILKQNHIEWERKTKKEIDLASVNKILSIENYIKSVDKVHFLGSKLQIEITLYDILLEVQPQNGDKFLISVEGVYLPYSPKIGNGVIIAQGITSCCFPKKETVLLDNQKLDELFTMASFIHEDSFYSKLFHRLSIGDNQELMLYPAVGNISVLFGSTQDAQSKFKSLKYMYKDVLPYINENQYAQFDVRFKNRIIATKSKT